jgi:hypothetical protein
MCFNSVTLLLYRRHSATAGISLFELHCFARVFARLMLEGKNRRKDRGREREFRFVYSFSQSGIQEVESAKSRRFVLIPIKPRIEIGKQGLVHEQGEGIRREEANG